MVTRWRVFGRWPSTHDVDLMLDADPATRRRLARWGNKLGGGYHFFRPADIPLDQELIQQAIDIAARCKPSPFIAYGEHALPMDAFFVCRPGGVSLAAWVPPPYTTWRFDWRPTHKGMFDGARDIDVPTVAPSPLLVRPMG